MQLGSEDLDYTIFTGVTHHMHRDSVISMQLQFPQNSSTTTLRRLPTPTPARRKCSQVTLLANQVAEEDEDCMETEIEYAAESDAISGVTSMKAQVMIVMTDANVFFVSF